MKTTLVFVLLTISFINIEASLPEDSIVGDGEELHRFKRESFMESILKHFPFFRHNFDTENEKGTEQESAESREDPEGLSFFSDNSIFDRGVDGGSHIGVNDKEKERRKHQHDIFSAPVIPLPASSLTVQSHGMENTESFLIDNTSVLVASSFQHLITVSSATIISSPMPKVDGTVRYMLATSAVKYFNSSQVNLRSTHFARNISLNLHTSKLDLQNINVSESLVSSSLSGLVNSRNHSKLDAAGNITLLSIPVSSFVYSGEKSSFNGLNPSTLHPLEKTSTEIPVKPHLVNHSLAINAKKTAQEVVSFSKSPMAKTAETEPSASPSDQILNKRFRIPVIIGNGEDKNVRFLYVNIVIPIVSGIMGAMLITFGIMMFRCCRRRRLKKVRYFGGKPSADLVGLDRMNLLSESSDDEYYN